ncbi:MAG: DUF3794 domain-containing protein [Ruminococcus sp.]|nr:DUF3794 domain-containing protein [Ruminococcus sp.]
MEFRLNREAVPAEEVIYSGVQEQGVELDYILPDYYPDIVRLVRCDVIPVVSDWSVSGDRLTYELRCEIRLLYCGEDGSELRCVTQKQNYSKTVELGRSTDSPEVTLAAKSDHINFRAVNKRRLDVRGAVSVRISVRGERSQEVVSDAFGMNIQLKKAPVRFAANRLGAEKTVQLSEEVTLSAAQPPVIDIVYRSCSAGECEKKIVSGKLLAKGEIKADILYSCTSGGSSSLEPMSFTLPFSQILDMEGLDDTYECIVRAEVISCEIAPAADKDGENRILRCEPELRLTCRAVKSSDIMVAVDAYSTVYPCEVEYSEIQAQQLPAVYAESFRHSAVLAEGDAVPAEIYALWCTPKNINTRVGEDGRSVMITGMLTYSMAAKDSSGQMIMPDRDEAFEEQIDIGDDLTGAEVSAELAGASVSYNISPEGVLTAKADIPLKISAGSSASIRAVTAITVDDSVKKQRDGDYAIKLYFGVENEDVWDIAKRYSTDASAIMEENELTGEKLENGRMLLIPIKE